MFGVLRKFMKPPKQDCWSAAAYLCGTDLIIHACNRTHNNFGWNSDPVVKISTSRSRPEIGAQVREVLLASCWDAAAPDLDGPDNSILKAANLRSWKQLERASRFVTIDLQNGRITVHPWRAARKRQEKGFLPMDDSMAITLPGECNDDDLAAAVFEALDRTIPWQPEL
jgi:hypothetical protein